MEKEREIQKDYPNFLVKCLERIKKGASHKKYKSFREEITSAIEILNKSPESESANSYFWFLKAGIELKNNKLTDLILTTLKSLISQGYLDGDCEDDCRYPGDENPPALSDPSRKLIDAIVESVYPVGQDKDENLQLQVVQVLLSLVSSFQCKLHDKSLVKAFKGIYIICISSKNAVNQSTGKGALNQIIHITFQRMEMTFIKGDPWSPLPSPQGTVHQTIDPPKQARFSILEEYMYLTVQNLVDEVCVYSCKVSDLERHYAKQMDSIEEELTKKELGAQMELAISNVPLRSVPLVPHQTDPKYKKLIQAEVSNERGIPAGKFGWCILCRRTADMYCKNTRQPLCSPDCKNRHMKMVQSLDIYLRESGEKDKYLNDALQLFSSMCKISLHDLPTTVDAISMKSKMLSLELLLTMVARPPNNMKKAIQFTSIIKGPLCDSILRNSVSNEKPIFSLSLSIFLSLFIHFRSFLKHEIAVFIEEIFLKVLDSGNSSYQHKFLILQVFNKLTQKAKWTLDLFVNYDCDVKMKKNLGCIIESLSKIAQGKYTKDEHANIIQPQEEYSLKVIALETLVQISQTSYEFLIKNDVELNESYMGNRSLLKESSPSSQALSTVQPSVAMEHASNFELNLSDHEEEKGAEISKYEKVLELKNRMEAAVVKFNIKPKNGIKYLVQVGEIAPESSRERHVADIVKFIKNNLTLDKTKIGDYFGEDIEINKEAMYLYIDSLNLRKLGFVDGIKHTLAGFRLPGEGQKVDRILMKFGEKFSKDNPKTFVSANAPYELSYAVMMLQTNLHNPNIKEKMDLEEFNRLCRDIRKSYNLSDEFMKTIHDDIASSPITLVDDEKQKMKNESLQASSVKKKQHLFITESQMLIKKSEELIKQRHQELFLEVEGPEPIRPMFQMGWSAMLAVFSMLFEETEEAKITSLCLNGFNYSIKICNMFNMYTEREAFIYTLSKFTGLVNFRDLKEKNMQSVKILLELAYKEGNQLSESWRYILECFSHLAHIHNLSAGAKQDVEFFSRSKDKKNKKKRAAKYTQDIGNAENLMSVIEQSKIDHIFANSVNLGAEGIIHFISALCAVSRDELADLENPRIYSLQKIVEVADSNMSRIKYVWTNIWRNISQHFAEVGAHANEQIAIYAIDSLRQLAIKFLKCEELSGYEFQREFLKPFETIMLANLQRDDIKDFIVTCTSTLSQMSGVSLKSGWTIVTNIFCLCAHENSNQSLVLSSFKAFNAIWENQYSLMPEYFEELINCLVKYTKSNYLNVALKAIENIALAANRIGGKDTILMPYYYKLMREQKEREVQPSESEPTSSGDTGGETLHDQELTFAVQKHLWSPILSGLANLLLDEREKIHSEGIKCLFNTFHLYASDFCPRLWSHIFKHIISPMFEDMSITSDNNKSFPLEYYETITKGAFSEFVELFAVNFDTMPELIPEFLEIIQLYITNIEDYVAKIGVDALREFVLNLGNKFGKNWSYIMITYNSMIESTLARELLNPVAKIKDSDIQDPVAASHPEEAKEGISVESAALGAGISFNKEQCTSKCIIQVRLLIIIKESLLEFLPQIDIKDILGLLESLMCSFNFSKEFNRNIDHRFELWRHGFMGEMHQLPALLRQMREVLATILEILFKLYLNLVSQREIVPELEIIRTQIFDLCVVVLEEYVQNQNFLIQIAHKRAALKEKGEITPSPTPTPNEQATKNVSMSVEDHKEQEAKRILVNMLPVLTQSLLPGLMQLESDHLAQHRKDITPLLLELIMSDSHELRRKLKLLLNKLLLLLP